MIIGIMILLFILAFTIGIFAVSEDSLLAIFLSLIIFLAGIIILFFGFFHGFINHLPTEGVHQGIITAVDLEGVYFRRYEVYLKSSGYTNQSDETTYLLYEYEKELAEELKNSIGKTVKIHYGHDGGYIGWKSCGTYHIKSIEIIEESE